MNSLSYRLGETLETEVHQTIEEWLDGGKIRRLWERDASLWTSSGEDQWLGWLSVIQDQLEDTRRFSELAPEVQRAGFSDIVVLGMGGSSLCPEVLSRSFGAADGFPELHILDSTDPARVRAIEARVELASTLFVVSSKSGSTTEPNLFKQYFFERVAEMAGHDRAGRQFIAITDPGSALEAMARRDDFRHVFYGVPDIGGRYSALSDFGMAPAAMMGIGVEKFLRAADEMASACRPDLSSEENPGLVLGVILGISARAGHDKVTLVASPGVEALGAWLEQLLAESTGKEGKGLVPVDREPLGAPRVYAGDRLFVYLRLDNAADADQERRLRAIEQAGHPVVRIGIEEAGQLGQEFFRWEVATAVAGSIMGIHPFNQPDVEASKIATRELSAQYEQSGSPPLDEAFLEEGGVRLFADPANATVLRESAGKLTLTHVLGAHIRRAKAGDYIALLAYLEMSRAHDEKLQAIRRAIRDSNRVATCAGFGPRFLHSTGQLHKGGPNTGVFLQITCDDAEDLAVPGRALSFGMTKSVQARGDLQVLADRERRVLRVHLPADSEAGLRQLEAAILEAL